MAEVVALGELLIDLATIGEDSGYPIFSSHPGGAPANFLAALSSFGISTSLIAKVGDDSFGHRLIKTLNEANIETGGVKLDSNSFTTLAFVTFDENNDREFSFARKPGADTMLNSEDIDYSIIKKAKVFHFGTLSLTDQPSRSATENAVIFAQREHKIISFDPNLRKPLWRDEKEARAMMLWGLEKADIVKISEEEVEFLFGQISKEEAITKILDEYNVRLLHITLGKNGSITANKNGFVISAPYEEVTVKDTTGAGDIFGGSAMYAFLKKGKAIESLSLVDLSDIAEFANIAAGLSTEKIGGISSVPTLSEVEERRIIE